MIKKKSYLIFSISVVLFVMSGLMQAGAQTQKDLYPILKK